MDGLTIKSMNENKALKKALQNRRADNLSYEFEHKMMSRILIEAERKKKRSLVWGLSIISVVSIGMIAATIYILTYFVSFSVHFSLPDIAISYETQSLFFAYCYIALLVLALLGIDAYFRNLRQKQHDKEP